MNYSTLSSNQLSFNSSRSQEPHQCSHLQQYKKTYNELSNLRIELRACQQQTEVLGNTVKGLEQQNKYLKGFLSNKKEIITKLNYEISSCNQEINRLEEENSRGKEAKFTIEQKYNALKQKEQQTQKIMNQLKNESFLLKEKVRVLDLEVKNRQKSLTQNRQLENQTQAIKNVCKMLQVNIQSFKSGKFEQLVVQTSNLRSKHEDQTLKQFYTKWNKLVETHKYQLQSLENQSKKQKNEITQLNSNIQGLKLQLTKEHQSLVLEKDKNSVMMASIQSKEKQHQDFANRSSLSNKNKEQILIKLINQLIQALRKYFAQQNKVVFQKILSLISKNEPELFQLDVLMNELWNLASLRYAVTLKHELSSKQVDKINQKYLELQQSYELLTLNNGILQRQYRQLLQDNRRLIKYNNISQFRLRRNMANQSSSEQQEQCALEKGTRKQQKVQSFKTQRKDYFKETTGNRTKQSHGRDKQNDYLAYNY